MFRIPAILLALRKSQDFVFLFSSVRGRALNYMCPLHASMTCHMYSGSVKRITIHSYLLFLGTELRHGYFPYLSGT